MDGIIDRKQASKVKYAVPTIPSLSSQEFMGKFCIIANNFINDGAVIVEWHYHNENKW